MNNFNANICFLEQNTNSLSLYINSYMQGHSILRYRIKDNDRYTFIPIESPMVTISNLDQENYYLFSTAKDLNSFNEDEYQIYFLFENINDTVDKILNNISFIKSYDILEDIRTFLYKELSIDPKQQISYLIYKYFIEIKDIQPNEIDTIYNILMAVQKYDNNKNIFWNKNISENFSIDYYGSGALNTNGLISKIVIKDYFGNFIKTIYTEGHYYIDLSINKAGYYYIYVYENNNLINKLTFVQFNDSIKAKIWKDKINNNEHISLLNEQYNITYFEDIILTEQEKQYFIEEMSKNPVYPLVIRPNINDIGNNNIMISIEDYDLLKTIGHTFYIGIKEQDTLFIDYLDNYVDINNKTIIFNCNKYFLNGEMLFFIEDYNGNIISELTRFSFDDDYNNYYNKVLRIKSNIYFKRLLSFIQNKNPIYKNFINSSIELILSNVTNHNYLWKSLIEFILLHGTPEINKNEIIELILEDFINNSIYDNSFYNEPIIYYRSTDTLVFPPSKKNNSGYTLIISTLKKSSNSIETEYIQSYNGAIDYSIKPKGQYIFYAIDNDTYKFSGITYINNINGEQCIFNYNLRMESI
ncbi:hypothetical protein DWZ11_00385 [Megamonas rupellensis]|uniref:Uncharacterized protein n=1 Tax=Megamonas rupellensis TaxID=491921 RepID=A0A411ZZY0_9FIRM|nr:hypothetical protein [Megamonas rupellensis]RGQ08350.1 hypothetical protein DWZ11_00385 [Megamonas rupellensis]